MRTPNLFPIPKRRRPATRLGIFKRKHGIWTFRSRGMETEHEPWTAMLLDGTKVKDAFGKIAENIERLESDGEICYGRTEFEAVKNLAEQNGIKTEGL